MRKEDYDLMHALETGFWWFAGMRKVTHALLDRHMKSAPRAILDVGCGTGINLLSMSQKYHPGRLVGCDYSPVAIGWCTETLLSAPTRGSCPPPRLCRGDVRSLPFKDRSFDLVTSLDVLDLFPQTGGDVQGLAQLYRILRPRGVAFVREPAYGWLFSSHDTVFETQHRYSTSELQRKMSSVGFKIIHTTYANTILFPLAATRRLLRKFAGLASGRTDTQPWAKALRWLNGPFTQCLCLEASWLARGRRLPFGLSAICIGLRSE